MIENRANFTRQGVMVVTKARVGVRLRRFREERGLTQAALASALGISPSYVNQLESSQRAMPAVGRDVIELHRRYRHGRDVNETIMTRIDAGEAGSLSVPPPMAQEEVQELFYARRNYFPVLDLAAEQIFTEAGLGVGNTVAGITDRLARRHGIRVAELPVSDQGVKRRYDPESRVLALSPLLNSGQRAFQLATHLASVELAGEIDPSVAAANPSGAA